MYCGKHASRRAQAWLNQRRLLLSRAQLATLKSLLLRPKFRLRLSHNVPLTVSSSTRLDFERSSLNRLPQCNRGLHRQLREAFFQTTAQLPLFYLLWQCPPRSCEWACHQPEHQWISPAVCTARRRWSFNATGSNSVGFALIVRTISSVKKNKLRWTNSASLCWTTTVRLYSTICWSRWDCEEPKDSLVNSKRGGICIKQYGVTSSITL